MAFDGIGIDIQHDFPADPDVLAPRIRAAEALGFDGLWLVGGTFPGAMSPLEALAFAAGITDRIRLGVAVLISPLFAPVHVARSALTVDRLSRGRLILGLGLGHGGNSYARHGVPTPAHRGRHFDANVSAIISLLRNEKTTCDDPPLRDEPRPLAPAGPGRPPVWLGGDAAGALDRAARFGDGWLGAGAQPITDFAGAADTVRARLAAHRRDPAAFALGKRVMVHVGERDAARAKLEGWYRRGTGDPSTVERTCVYGPPDDVVAGLARLREQGAEHLVLTPLVDVDEQMERLAADVCPRLA